MEGKHGKPKVISLVLEEGVFKTHSTRKYDMREPISH